MIGYWNPANAVTLMGALFGLMAGLLPLTHSFRQADLQTSFLAGMICLVLAGICDLFDGLVARNLDLSPDEQAFGIQLDSLVDLLSFGVAPVLLYSHYIYGYNAFPSALFPGYRIGWMLILIAYLGAVIMRLAFFNVHGLLPKEEAEENAPHAESFYAGLPVTYAAMVLPLVQLTVWQIPWPSLQYLTQLLMFLCLTLLYLTPIPIPKPRGKAYIFFPLLALSTLAVYGGLILQRF